MTKNMFNAICAEHLIDPEIALENEIVRKALADKNDMAVIEALESEF